MSADQKNAQVEFLNDIREMIAKAEGAFERIKNDPDKASGEFSVFEEWMIAIRGTAAQFRYERIAAIASLGEELSVKAQKAPLTGSQIRKCLGALWDVLATIRHWLGSIGHDAKGESSSEFAEEEGYLITRLEKTLEALGGARPTFSSEELDRLF